MKQNSKQPAEALTDKQKQAIRKRQEQESAEQLAASLSAPTNLVREYIAEINPKLSSSKRLVFTLLMIALPIVLLGATELALRAVQYGGPRALFLSADFDSRYMIVNRNIGTRYFPSQSVTPAISYDVFLKQKPENGYRIFVLGGSSAAGYPYLYNGAFSKMLLPRLQDAFPDRKIEMINLAMPAVNSYTLLDLADEIMPWQPDALLIYAGHNEFYGALGIGSSESLGQFRGLINGYLRLQAFRAFQLLRDIVLKIAGWVGKPSNSEVAADRTLMERMVGEQEIAWRGESYERAQQNFSANLRDLIALAAKQDVPVLLSELVSNVRDQKPFVSLFDAATDKVEWQTGFDEAVRLQAAGQFARALASYRQVAVLDSTPAIVHFRMAQCLEKLGAYEQAKAQFYRAKDLDGLRFRASEDFNEAIRLLGAETGSAVVPLQQAFEAASPNGLIGKDLMLEHLHPNLRGYFLMAKAFSEAMCENHFIAENWDARSMQADSVYWQDTGVTPIDEKVIDIRIEVLLGGWPFQPKNAPNRAADFVPGNFLEQTALSMWKNDITWERAHVQMADYYQQRGELDKAAAEYKALIRYMPINISPYVFLIRIYLQQQNFNELLALLPKTLEIEETALARKWLGILALKDGQAKIATDHLQRAFELEPDDLQTMYNLCGAYALSGETEKAKALTEQLLQRAPSYPGAGDLLRQLQ